MAYNLFKTSDPVTPFIIVNDNTIDNTSAGLNLIGRRKENYGQPLNQNFLWSLENFADTTPPPNPVTGQLWYNTVDEQIYVCTDELLETFEKVSNPLVSTTAPSLSLQEGNLWYDSVNSRLYIYNGATWDLIGPSSNVPLAVQESFFMGRLTSDATTSEMWLNGNTNERLVIPNNTTWLFEVTLVARRTNAAGERRSWKFDGVLDNTSNSVVVDGSPAVTILSQTAGTAGYAATLSADNTNKSLLIQVTGEAGKNISWNSVVKLTKV